MKIKLLSILRYFACLGIFITAYPVISLANGYLQKGNSILESVILILFAMIIFTFRDSLITRLARPAVSFFLPILLIIAVSVFAVISQTSIFAMIIGGIIALIIGVLAFCLAGKEPLDMFPASTLIFITLIDLVCTFLIWKSGFSFEPLITIAAYFFLCAVYYVLLNQESLRNLTASRHYSLSALPPKIRSYNLALIGKLMLIMAAAYFIFRNLKFILTWLGDKLYGLWIYLMKFFMSLFSSSPSSEEIAPPPPSGMDKPQLPPVEASSSILGDIIFFILQIIVICGIIAFIVYLIYRLSKWRVPKKVREITPEYTDDEQPLIPLIHRRHNPADSRRRWKRDYYAYQKKPSGLEKFRTGYKLAIRGLLLNGLPLKNSDTTCEIDDKASKTLQQKAYHAATANYNFMAYGEINYSQEALHSLDNALAEIAELKK